MYAISNPMSNMSIQVPILSVTISETPQGFEPNFSPQHRGLPPACILCGIGLLRRSRPGGGLFHLPCLYKNFRHILLKFHGQISKTLWVKPCEKYEARLCRIGSILQSFYTSNTFDFSSILFGCSHESLFV